MRSKHCFFGGLAMHKIGFATLAAGLLTLAGGTTAWAQSDTIRLGTSAANSVTGGTDTELVRGRGGYHAHWGGGYGYRRGYWGGYGYNRGYWGGYGYAGYRPYYYRPAYYRPLVYVNYYQPYYYPSPVYYYPISGQAQVQATYVQTPAQAQLPAPPYQTTTNRPQLLPQPATVPQQQPEGPQTFPYDGGPQAPLPDVDPASGPRPFIPLQGKIVSLPRETTLGSTQHLLVSLNSRTQSTAGPAPNAYAYLAYGEQPLPVVRKQTK
jgi:hypothetical protein